MTGLSGTGRLADDLYLLAHYEATGKPRLQPRAAGLGLAGALLAELMLTGNIGLRADQIVVADCSRPRDALGRSVLNLVAGERDRHPARDWLVFLARTATHSVAGRLEKSGYLTSVSTRRPWRVQQWVPVESDFAFAPLLRVKSALDPSRPASAQNVALAGLAEACGLGRHLALYLPDGVHRRIEQATRQLHPELRDLIAHTQAAVDSALLSHRV